MTRYGVQWADGSITGLITDKHHLAAHYAREYGGRVYEAKDEADLEAEVVRGWTAQQDEALPA